VNIKKLKNLKKGGGIQFVVAGFVLAILFIVILIGGELPSLEFIVIIGIIVIFNAMLGLAGEMEYQAKKYKR
jgi:hypothetical protein